MAYAAILNGLLPDRFKFSLLESKVATLADALRRAQDFTQATEKCVGKESQHQENRKRTGGGHFHRSPCNIPMEIKGSLSSDDPSPSKLRPTFEIRTNIVSYMRISATQHLSVGS